MYDHELFQAEKKWGGQVFTYLTDLYHGHWLPSHDIAHHRRVWKNACRLANGSFTDLFAEDEFFAEKLFLACFFHDTGLLVEQGEYHGAQSRKICEEFLSERTGIMPFEAGEVLEAIENHDDKNYELLPGYHFANLKTILSMADDMDAFGAVGVYRYVEIYILRGIVETDVAERILRNASSRYAHLKAMFSGSFQNNNPLATEYNRLCKLLGIQSYTEEPYCLVHWIRTHILDCKLDPFVNLPVTDKAVLKNRRIIDFLNFFSEEIESNSKYLE